MQTLMELIYHKFKVLNCIPYQFCIRLIAFRAALYIILHRFLFGVPSCYILSLPQNRNC